MMRMLKVTLCLLVLCVRIGLLSEHIFLHLGKSWAINNNSFRHLFRICALFLCLKRRKKIFYFFSSFMILRKENYGNQNPIPSYSLAVPFIYASWYSWILCSYVGRLFVKSISKPIDVITKLNKMAGFDPDEEIELFEVCMWK